jgi:hypothetical protein
MPGSSATTATPTAWSCPPMTRRETTASHQHGSCSFASQGALMASSTRQNTSVQGARSRYRPTPAAAGSGPDRPSLTRQLPGYGRPRLRHRSQPLSPAWTIPS